MEAAPVVIVPIMKVNFAALTRGPPVADHEDIRNKKATGHDAHLRAILTILQLGVPEVVALSAMLRLLFPEVPACGGATGSDHG